MSLPNPELGLGTVAFGVDYGITNTHGAPSDDVVRGILDTAHRAGITLYDTAADYGTAQERLGNLTRDRSSESASSSVDGRYVTKFSLAVDGSVPTRESLFGKSMSQLGVDHLEGVLFHKLSDLSDNRRAHAVEILRDARAAGTVNRIGVSIYDEADLENALNVVPDLDLIQLPANVFDVRLLDSVLLSELVSRGVQVHVRSAFLQGLVFAHPDALPTFFAPLKAPLTALHEEAARREVSVQSIALGALKFHPHVSAVIVGAQSPSELQDIVDAWTSASAPTRRDIELADIPAAVLDPRQWPSTKVES